MPFYARKFSNVFKMSDVFLYFFNIPIGLVLNFQISSKEDVHSLFFGNINGKSLEVFSNVFKMGKVFLFYIPIGLVLNFQIFM